MSPDQRLALLRSRFSALYPALHKGWKPKANAKAKMEQKRTTRTADQITCYFGMVQPERSRAEWLKEPNVAPEKPAIAPKRVKTAPSPLTQIAEQLQPGSRALSASGLLGQLRRSVTRNRK